MTKNTEIHAIDEYIEEVGRFLPYSKEKMQEALDELRVDVESAIIDTGEKSPTKVFGTPRDVAMNIVESHPYWYTNRAGWWIRLGAFMFDFVIEAILIIINIGACFLVTITLITPYDDLWQEFESWGNETFDFFDLFTPEKLLLILVISFFTITAIICILGYNVVLEYYFGATLGKKIFNLLVVSQTGLRITWKQAIIRNFSKIIISEEFLPLDVVLGMILEKMDPEKAHKQRGLDILAETIVIKL